MIPPYLAAVSYCERKKQFAASLHPIFTFFFDFRSYRG